MAGNIRVGIGGWTYEPWRETFYPPKHPKARELEYACTHVTAIEINGTYYSTQKPATWADWHKRTPEGFVFSVKASRFCTNRRVLADGKESVEKFLHQGLTELGPKLGPILWQFMATKKFDADDFAAFLDLLPDSLDGLPLRHALEPRHESFRDPRFIELMRKRGAAIVIADDETHPQIADLTGDLVYARLQRQREEEPTGYSAAELDDWAAKARSWAAGDAPLGLDYVAAPEAGKAAGRDVLIFMINGAKVRAPHAAMGLIDRLG